MVQLKKPLLLWPAETLLAMLCMLVTGSCVEPYEANINPSELNALVVDGFFNATDASVAVTLSRTRSIGDQQPRPERGATVFLDEEGGKPTKAVEVSPGQYKAGGMVVNYYRRYRLRMVVKSREYVSEYVEIQQTPVIDSISWKPLADGVGINVSTHGPGTSGYYQWTYEETWKYRSYFQSYWTFDGPQWVYRTEDQQIYNCWKTEPSTKISVAATAQLSENRISEFELLFIPKDSRKISLRYSILVQQRSLSKAAFDYWRQLQKTTENLGGLFDPLPGKIVGNLRCNTVPGETVVGYFNASTTAQARIFLDFNQLPLYLRTSGFIGTCQLSDTVLLADVLRLKGAYNLTDAIYERERIIGFRYSTFECTDCRLAGGTLTKPSWWE